VVVLLCCAVLWSCCATQVTERLQRIMKDIYESSKAASEEYGVDLAGEWPALPSAESWCREAP